MKTTSESMVTILVVEDDAGDFGLIEAYIKRSCLTGTGAPAAAQAGEPALSEDKKPLRWAKTLHEGIVSAQGSRPDIILLDLSLPDSAGLATVREMRAAAPGIPIVVLTGRDDDELADAALEAGAQDYLVKGQFDHDTLCRAVRHARAREKLEQRLAHASQLYAALSQCNKAIVRCTGEDELFAEACRIAVRFGGLKMAWIGLVDGSGRVRPVARFGSGTAYLMDIDITTDGNTPQGCGPTGTAIREARPVWCQDFMNSATTAHWHQRSAPFGFGASASLPLMRDKLVIGAFNLYAGEANVFAADSCALLVEMAGDISFALNNFARNSERLKAEDSLRKLSQAVEQSRNTIIITDLQGRIEYANAAFVQSSGYSLSEAIGQNPRLLHSGKTPHAVYEDMWMALRDGEAWRGEFINRRKDGSEYVESAHISPVRQPNGMITHYLAIKEDITLKKEADERILWLSHFDTLTGLANHSVLADRFEHALSMAEHSGTPLSLIYLDLDHFKHVNDTLGRHIGDALLVEIARRIEGLLHEEDTVSRQGGDEFILLLPTSDAGAAAHLADRLLGAIAKNYWIEAHELTITPSIGIAVYPDDGRDFETLSKAADVAMYRAKQDGRNCYRFFAAEMQQRSMRTLQLENALRHAVERGQMELHYQPQISLTDGSVVGAEALLRWTHPEFGAVSSAEFIPIAEASGQIVQIGEWVLRTAIRQMKVWIGETAQNAAAGALGMIAVNLSVVQFRHPKLIERIMSILAEEGLPARHLELELTEGVALENPQGAVAIMNSLFQQGIRMAIDDFGTGYSSLSYLKRFKAYKLKIDQSFVRDIGDDPEDRAIVSAVISMAKSLGLKTIAEGVETEGQLAYLREQGCDEVQGYLFSRPLPVAEFEHFLAARLASPAPVPALQ